MNEQVNPSSIAPPAARYAHAVLSVAPNRMLHTSGVVPIRPDGTVPEDAREQANVVWSNIAVMLAEANMTKADIVSVTTYVVVGQALGPIMEQRDVFLDGTLAASTLVTVPELARPEWKVEIAVVAVS